ncbi:hypothetical protein N0B31_01635 [Salinirubellus salinus]|uniref:Uncharacterized protein n=1 Tax=Salinirubellus salinus TaxID=1364945 RepID=A0A9E7UBA5_9EURY|nr:hypothetical protein [Salinirubellus salinus]UWM54993.1 hypothetical protein N0B31_01635 [Salinirubellus salinus]
MPPSSLARLAPPTLARVDLDRFLALGALVGAVGWGATALLTARPDLVADPVLVSVALWGVLVAVMVGVGVFATPDEVRFSRPMLVWGPANALASLVTLAVLFGPLPAWTLPDAWALAGLVGYYASARATEGNDRNVYLTAAFFEVTTFGTGTSPAVFVALGVCHVVPLVLVAFTDFRRAPYVLGGVWLAVVLAATFL